MTEQTLTPARAVERELVLRVYPGLLAFLFTLLVVSGLSWLYFATQRTVTLSVNGLPMTFKTHQQTIADLLADNGIRLNDADIVLPPLNSRLDRTERIQLFLAQPVELQADGQTVTLFMQSGSVADVLQAAGIRLTPADRLWFDDDYVSPNTLLSQLRPAPLDLYGPRIPLHISLLRPVPIVISDDGASLSLLSDAPTVRDVLRANDFRLHPNDRIAPALDTLVSAGLHISIERSKPLSILVDGKTVEVHTREQTVARALTEAGIKLDGKDYSRPPVTTRVLDNMQIQVVRVREVVFEQASVIPFVKLLQPDDNLEIDQQQLTQVGVNGEHRKAYRITYENGVEVRRTLEKEWDSLKPQAQVTAYGRKIVPHEIDTPDGKLTYWRKIQVYTTSYSPMRSGVSQDKPWYGHTYSGLPAGKGIAAVDQSVFPWLSHFYVFGYGFAIAGDTGSGVHERLVDLGFSDDDYESWHQWTDAYLLWPPPAPQQIRWLLPDGPHFGRRP